MARVQRWIRPSILTALLLATTAPALELADSRWGFDGTVLPGRINVVSARFFNPDAQAFDGVVKLRNKGFGGHKGAVHEARVYVSPQTYRWVQFYVEPDNIHETYELEFPLTPKRTETKTFDSLSLGAPARAFLLNPRDTSPVSPRIPGFPAEAFPASVSALESLQQLVIDHAPDFDAPRRQALLDWLHLGGVVHLLRDREGRLPRFEGDLAVLNGEPSSSSRLGCGAVVRHALPREEATGERLDAAGFAPSVWSKPDNDAYYGYMPTLSGGLLQTLRQSILPQHPWGMINLILLCYIGLVGPGQYFLVKRMNLDYRLSLLLLVALVAVFSVVFYQIGLRGYKNRSLVVSITRADVLPGNRAALTQWAQAFTRNSHKAEMSHTGAAGLYDLPSTDESIPAVVRNGAQAVLSARMPVNSTLPFVYRGVAAMALPSLEWMNGDANRLKINGKLPAEVLAAYHWQEGEDLPNPFHLAEVKEGELVLGGKRVEFNTNQHYGHNHSSGSPPEAGDLTAFLQTPHFREKVLPDWVLPVLSRERNVRHANQNNEPHLLSPAWRRGDLHVWLVTAALPGSATQDNPLPAHQGVTLLHWQLPPPAAATTP